jgi:hypothetical protein
MHPIPNSPPPSFRSRASSRERSTTVSDDLADAFDADGDESDDDEADDRQRLVRGNSTPSFNSESSRQATVAAAPGGQSAQHQRPTGAAPTSSRVYGSGIQADGVFSNLSAKPERGDGEKDELPPVSPAMFPWRLRRSYLSNTPTF